MKIIFICHTEEIVEKLYKEHDNPIVLFVGMNPITISFNNLIIVRDLPYHIENDLIFSAWYAIIKNNLFNDEYLCLFEYVTFDSFQMDTSDGYDVYSFIESNENIERYDITSTAYRLFIEKKGMQYKKIDKWMSTTNHCMKQSVLKEFVDWYYPDCLSLKVDDPDGYRFYHERLFYFYIDSKGHSIKKIEGINTITHQQKLNYESMIEDSMIYYNSNQIDIYFPIALKIFQHMILTTTHNEFITQSLSNVYYNKKDYINALELNTFCVKHNPTIENLENRLRIIDKLEKDEYEIYRIDTLCELFKLTSKISYIEQYITIKLKDYNNALDIYDYILTLNIDRKTLITLVTKIVLSHPYLFLKYGVKILSNFLERLYKKINDESALLYIKKGYLEEQFICILYLILPQMYYDDTRKEYLRIKSNLQKLVDIKDCLCQSEHINLYYTNNITYYYTYFGENIKELLQHFCILMRQIFPLLNYKKKFTHKRKDKIKIGFFSNFIFKNHSVCRDRLGIIKSLCNDDLYDVYLIHFEHNKEKEILHNTILKDTFYHDTIVSNSYKEIINEISDLNLDILVYPEIGMDFDIYIMSFTRLAPIQINTWGHSDTSGIDTIDYYISSKYYENKSSQINYSEKLILLNSLSTYYYDISTIFDDSKFTDPLKLRSEFQLYDSYHIYGVFQTVFKYHSTLLTMISKILIKDPKSLFFILIPKSYWKDFMKYSFNFLGYQSYRVKMIDSMDKLKYCNTLRCMDIMIDSYPFGGCNTTLDSFYFNKIVLTLPSTKLNGKFSEGFYKKMGIMEPICKSVDDMVDKAIYYMEHDDKRKEVEEEIRCKKYLLFNERDSLIDWNNMLRQLMNVPKLKVVVPTIVLSRYKENIEYVSTFREPCIVYNKGDDITIPCITLPNIGKCDHSYLYHIIENYEKLHDITIFLPASYYYIPKKVKIVKELFEKVYTTNGKYSIFIGTQADDIILKNYEFVLNNYETLFVQNRDKSVLSSTEKSPIRPFGKWCEHIYGNIKCNYINYWGIMAIRKEDILKNPIDFYKQLLSFLQTPNPEAGHFIERTYSLMFPHSKEQFISI